MFFYSTKDIREKIFLFKKSKENLFLCLNKYCINFGFMPLARSYRDQLGSKSFQNGHDTIAQAA